MLEIYYRVTSQKFKGEDLILETKDKKAADAHDKMLTRAENIYEGLEDVVKNMKIKSKKPEDQMEEMLEEISIHMSKNATDFAAILRSAKKK